MNDAYCFYVCLHVYRFTCTVSGATCTRPKPSSLSAIGEHFISRMSIACANCHYNLYLESRVGFFYASSSGNSTWGRSLLLLSYLHSFPLLETNEGLKQRHLEQRIVMVEEQVDDSSSLKSTGYVFLLSQGLESTTPTQCSAWSPIFIIFFFCCVLWC